MYQMLQRKQEFISQIMTSKAIARSADDIDEKALSYAEIKALAAGNPLIIKKTELDAQVAKLKLLKQSYLNQKYNLEDMIVKHYPIEIKRLEDKLSYVQEDIKSVQENTNIENEEKFSPMILNGKQYSTKESAGKQILEMCSAKQETELEEIGEYRGLKMFLGIDSFDKKFVINLQGKYSYKVDLGNDIHGNITRIDNVITGFNKELETTKEKLEETKIQFENAKEAVEIPFDKEDELKQKSQELDEINNLKECAIDNQEYEKAANLRDRELELLDNLEKEGLHIEAKRTGTERIYVAKYEEPTYENE